MSQPQPSWASDIYSGAADLGQISTTIGLVIGIILAIALIIGGIYMINKKNPHTAFVDAIVQTVKSCSNPIPDINNKGSSTYNCLLTLSFTLNGKNYIVDYAYNNANHVYVQGEPLTIFYDPNNPNDISLDSEQADKTTGWILIAVAVIIVLFAGVSFWLSRRYKAYAALQGGEMVFGGIRNVI